MITHIHSGGFA